MKRSHAEEGPSIAKVRAALDDAGATAGPEHVEIYLNDPGRTKPEKLRTVLLIPLARRRPAAVQARRLPARRPAAQELRVPSNEGERPLVR